MLAGNMGRVNARKLFIKPQVARTHKKLSENPDREGAEVITPQGRRHV